jgi:hypothetical protein
MNIEPINEPETEPEIETRNETRSPETHDVEVVSNLEPYRMRCPNCRKLYSVEPKLLGTSETELSKFECVGCLTAFFALKPEFHGAHFLQTQLLETQFAPYYHQPSSLPTIDGFDESDVVDSKVLEQQVRSAVMTVPLEQTYGKELGRGFARELEFAESAELVALWQAVVDDYLNTTKHESFVALCLEKQRLAYASHKYAQILVNAPAEEIARKMRERVIGLASYGFDAKSNGLSRFTWQFPLPSFNSFIILLGSILVVVGFGFPHARQTAGLGFAMIALALGLRFFVRRPRA